jgi:hypothetical protein
MNSNIVFRSGLTVAVALGAILWVTDARGQPDNQKETSEGATAAQATPSGQGMQGMRMT